MSDYFVKELTSQVREATVNSLLKDNEQLRVELKEAVEIIRTVFPNEYFLNANTVIRDRADAFLSRHQETGE